MRILIIGHSVVDHIDVEGRFDVKPGGVFYSTAAFVNIIEPGNEIFLLTQIDKENEKLFKSVYSKVELSYIERISEMPVVNLKIWKDKERDEFYTLIPKSMDINVINDLNQFDGILINMISGIDITLGSLQKIRSTYRGSIYLDIHCLAKGFDESKKRFFRSIDKIDDWLKNLDFIQANEHELHMICNESDEMKIAEYVLKRGPKFLIVTKGERGVWLYRKLKGEIISIKKPAIDVEVINKVGCGDVFGAAFFYSYILTKDIEASLNTANIAAGIITTYKDVNNFKNLKNDILERIN
ncbi:MAG: hypothetical protein A2V66_00380 [Ignavibacteria bacterium RBG_13_36_8]|nr:MAG: hypothetical protein A2V66_00380 [Ignavibacteria bacterium RBG_13_36_8]